MSEWEMLIKERFKNTVTFDGFFRQNLAADFGIGQYHTTVINGKKQWGYKDYSWLERYKYRKKIRDELKKAKKANSDYTVFLDLCLGISSGEPFGIKKNYKIIVRSAPRQGHYVCQIRKLLNGIQQPRIVEIGVGFGLLPVLLNRCFSFNQYECVDYPVVLELAKFFIDSESPTISDKMNYVDNLNILSIRKHPDLLVSFDCLGELPKDILNKTIENIGKIKPNRIYIEVPCIGQTSYYMTERYAGQKEIIKQFDRAGYEVIETKISPFRSAYNEIHFATKEEK